MNTRSNEFSICNLRLAARTLIEWKTPRQAPAHLEVRSAILRVHPFAVDIGIEEDDRVFECDNHGALLWYLSETMDASSSSAPRYASADRLDYERMFTYERSAEIPCTKVRNFLTSTHIGASDGTVWDNGPLKSEVVAMIVNGLALQNSAAQKAIVSLMVPLDCSLQKKYIGTLGRLYGKQSITIGRFSKRAGALNRLLNNLGTSLLVSALLSLIPMEMFSSFASHSFEFSIWTIIPIAFFVSSLAAFGGAIFANSERILQVFNRALRETKIIRANAIQSGEFDSWVRGTIVEFERICCSELGVFRNILEDHLDTAWADIALEGADMVSVPILKETIPLLRTPGLKDELKYRLVLRLAR